jgi:hypothetical protein
MVVFLDNFVGYQHLWAMVGAQVSYFAFPQEVGQCCGFPVRSIVQAKTIIKTRWKRGYECRLMIHASTPFLGYKYIISI